MIVTKIITFFRAIRKVTFKVKIGLEPSFIGLKLVSFGTFASSVIVRKTWFWLSVVLSGLDLDRRSGGTINY